jgi:hypothetical protein
VDVRKFALFAGVQFVLFGILGFIPGITQSPPPGAPPLAVDAGYGQLLGLLPVNILHNLFHGGSGLIALAASRSSPASRLFSRGLAIVYGVLTVLGLIPGLNTTLGLIPIYGADVIYHGLLAVAAAYFGFMAPARAGEHLTAARH